MKLRHPVANQISVVRVAGPIRATAAAPLNIFPSDQRYGRVGSRRVSEVRGSSGGGRA